MISELLDFVRETAVSTGKLTQEKWLTPLTISEKGYQDIVTDADIAAQAFMTDQIKANYPTHGFLTEEDDASLPADGDLIWIIDPIDGTTNYSRLQPQYCISIAVAQPVYVNDTLADFDILAGAIYDPERDELFSAGKGIGAFLNGRFLNTSKVDTLENAIIGLDLSDSKRLNWSSRDIVVNLSRSAHGVRILGSAAIGLAWVAAGRFDAYFNISLKPWDVAAGYLLISEAQGCLTNSLGSQIVWNEVDIDCVATNGAIQQELIHFIAKRV